MSEIDALYHVGNELALAQTPDAVQAVVVDAARRVLEDSGFAVSVTRVIAVAVLAVVMLGGNLLLRWGRRDGGPVHAPVTGGPLVIRPPRRNAIMFGITALIPAVLLGSVTLTWWRLGHMGAAGVVTANDRWCDVDFLTFESVKVPNVHVLGDAIQVAPAMPKSEMRTTS